MSIITTEELENILELVNSVPEAYRLKCFEILLINTLQMKQPIATVVPTTTPGIVPPSVPPVHHPFILSIDVKAFLSQYGLDESLLWKFFIIEGEEIRPLYQLQATRKARAQIQHALMLSLENAILKGQFQFDIEALRNRCTEQKCYDAPNFTKNIKDNVNLFKSIANDQPLVLSPDGKSELAELLEQLKG
jgi:hypothetical protein